MVDKNPTIFSIFQIFELQLYNLLIPEMTTRKLLNYYFIMHRLILNWKRKPTA